MARRISLRWREIVHRAERYPVADLTRYSPSGGCARWPPSPRVEPSLAQTLTRRHALRSIAAGGVAALAGVLTACAGAQQQPAAKGAPTLVPTRCRPLPRPVPRRLSPPRRSRSPGRPRRPRLRPPRSRATLARRDLVILQGADVTTLDPHLSTFGTDVNATFAIFDNLTFRNEDQSAIRPMLATEWKVQERRWELKLRPNVRFHNGDTLTSDDVKFSIERTYDPSAKTSVANVFSTVEHIETPDPLTVVFITRQPDALLPARLASTAARSFRARTSSESAPDGFRQRPVGTGPFRFAVGRRTTGWCWSASTATGAARRHVERILFRPRPEAAPGSPR